MKLNEKIVYMRKKAGLSQEELAEILGVSRQAVSKWETGESTPELSKLAPLSRAFGVTADWLISEEGLDAENMRREEPTPEDPVTEDPTLPLPEWAEALPGPLKRAMRRLGWRFGRFIAVAGGVITAIGTAVRIIVGEMEQTVTADWVISEGTFMYPAPPAPSDGFTMGPAYVGPVTAAANIAIVGGAILLAAGIFLAIAIRRGGGGK